MSYGNASRERSVAHAELMPFKLLNTYLSYQSQIGIDFGITRLKWASLRVAP